MDKGQESGKRRPWVGTVMIVVGAFMLLAVINGFQNPPPKQEGSAYAAGHYTAQGVFLVLGVGLIARGVKRRSRGGGEGEQGRGQSASALPNEPLGE